MAPMARGHLSVLLDPAKKELSEAEVDGILLYDKAIQLALSGERHNLSENIGALLGLIESHKKAQDSNMEETFGKMHESLSAKKQLSEEIADFETKQRMMINLTLVVIVVCAVCFCCCWVRHKTSSSGEADDKAKGEVKYELTGTPEEQEKKATSMKKIVETLHLMDEEIVKMNEELAALKKRS